MAKAKKPMIVLGSGALQRSDSAALLSMATKLSQKVKEQNGVANDWKVFNVLHRVRLVLFKDLLSKIIKKKIYFS